MMNAAYLSTLVVRITAMVFISVRHTNFSDLVIGY